jgi:hypothetical protein
LKKLRFVLLLLAFSTLIFNIVQTGVYASPFELAHDDGEFDYGWSDFYPSAAMVRFSPPIKTLKAYLNLHVGRNPLLNSLRWSKTRSTVVIR